MAGYGDLNRIQDEPVRSVLKQAFDQIQILQREIAALRTAVLQKGTTIDVGGLRLTNGADATKETDVPTLRQVRDLVNQVKKATY